MWLCLVVVGSVGGGVVGTTPAWVLMSSGIDMVKTLKPKTFLLLLLPLPWPLRPLPCPWLLVLSP